MAVLLWIAFGLFTYAFYKWAVANNNYFIEKGIKFIKPYILLGSNANMITQQKSLPEFIVEIYNAFPKEK
jgi:cytochrome P450 family 9